jgi:fumarate reductase subunit C
LAQKKQYPELPRKHLGPGWWLANRPYTLYMIRELTSFFVAVFSILYIYQVALLAGSPGSYDQYLTVLRNPFMIGFSVIILAFTLYHSLTWFYLIGRVQPLKIGGKKTTPVQSLIVNTVLLAIISVIVISLFLAGR